MEQERIDTSTSKDSNTSFASAMDNTGTLLSGTNEEERGTVRNETGEQGNSDQSGTSQEHEKEENVDEEDEDLFAAYEIDHPVSQPGNEETEAANASEHIQLEGSQDEQEVQKERRR
ncbi:unnamed protein product [Pichia kudriavzevii]